MTDSTGANEVHGPLFPTWDEKDPLGSLKALFHFTVERGLSQIDWYKRNVAGVRWGSRVCRCAAIIFISIGSLLPLIAAAGIGLGWNGRKIPFEFGYVAFALAAGFLGFDKYFGLSTAWIRYIKTQLALEAALHQLQLDWVALLLKIQASSPAPDQIQAAVRRLLTFVQYMDAQIQQETDAWVLEFQANLAELAKAAQVRAEAQKPGQILVTVTNAAEFDDAPAVTLDGTETKQVESGQCNFLFVPPGDHQIQVIASKAGKPFRASQTPNVSAGGTSRLSLTLTPP
ncbi:MAG TPA: SLATT domain-containing protein [Terriglobia bacterium]|nr:SLATT domain-containing protein [Terriglobia bacterium]